MKTGYVWIRIGDNDDYKKFDSPFDAGDRVGNAVNVEPQDGEEIDRLSFHGGGSGGVSVGGFRGDNYISLFWGDNDAQLIRPLNKRDQADFTRGYKEGSGLSQSGSSYIYHEPSKTVWPGDVGTRVRPTAKGQRRVAGRSKREPPSAGIAGMR